MDQPTPGQPGIFDASLDETAKKHLWEAAKWGRVVAVLGFIGCALGALSCIYVFTRPAALGSPYSMHEAYDTGEMATIIILVIGVVFLYFLGFLFLYRFATKMRAALMTSDSTMLSASFQNLKIMFRYIGILTIIFMALYALGLLSSLGQGV